MSRIVTGEHLHGSAAAVPSFVGSPLVTRSMVSLPVFLRASLRNLHGLNLIRIDASVTLHQSPRVFYIAASRCSHVSHVSAS